MPSPPRATSRRSVYPVMVSPGGGPDGGIQARDDAVDPASCAPIAPPSRPRASALVVLRCLGVGLARLVGLVGRLADGAVGLQVLQVDGVARGVGDLRRLH